MVSGSLVGRERRPLLVALSLILIVAIGTCLLLARGARAQLTDEAVRNARIAAQTQLTPLLSERDLEVPITGQRYEEVSAGVQEKFTTPGPITAVTIWSSMGRILYSTDQSVVGTRPSYMRDLAYSVANGSTKSSVSSGVLKTYAPVWVQPGGAVAVAEMDQPYGPIVAEADHTWYRLALALVLALVATIALLVLSIRSKAFRSRAASKVAPAVVYEPSRPTKAVSTPEPSHEAAPVYAQPGFRDVEEARQVAEERARAAEEEYRTLQAEHKEALEQIEMLEAQVEVRRTTSSQAEEEVRTLRDKVREATERLDRAEVDANALRERLALQKAHLDRTQGEVQTARERMKELERELEAAHAELEQLRSRAHIAKLSEALQGLAAKASAEQEPAEDVVLDTQAGSPTVIIGRSTTPTGPSPSEREGG
jgi:peptidoglycan hydrolase CwlO-like protein